MRGHSWERWPSIPFSMARRTSVSTAWLRKPLFKAMAAVSSSLCEEQFLCCICLEVFTDPVTTSCGHSFCCICINKHWDNSVHCSCPVCLQNFRPRPQLKVNIFMSEMVSLLRSKPQGEDLVMEPQTTAPGEVLCDLCPEPRLRALKSCLLCLLSYCESHLQPHLTNPRLKRHQLLHPLPNLEERICPEHQLPLEIFCRDHSLLVCLKCITEDHRNHQTVSLKEQGEEQQATLKQQIKDRDVKVQEIQRSVERSQRNADTEIREGLRVFTALMECVQQSADSFKQSIVEKQQQIEEEASQLIEQIQTEICELEQRGAEMEKLWSSEDHLHFVQTFTTIKPAPQLSAWRQKILRTPRSVLCNDPDLSQVPSNFPADTSKLRLEKTSISRLPPDRLRDLKQLAFLWMSFNSISSLTSGSFRGLENLIELRLEGNLLAGFPWESLEHMPELRLLDLHNNRISSVPSEAAAHIRNLTYLDLSGNKLGTLPGNVLAMWLGARPGAESESKRILGLHDNPWVCDCRLFDLVQYQRSPGSSVALMDTRLKCTSPDSLEGVLFSEAELQRCQSPKVHTAVARVRSSLGNNVLLRCGTMGVPVPELTWCRADGKKLNGTIQQELSKEGIIWSILSVPAVSYRDSGKYVCKATNFVGTADAVISLVITDSFRSEETSGTSKRNRGGRKNGIGRAAYQEKLIARYVPPPPTGAPNQPIIEPLNQKAAATGKYEIESYSVSQDGKSTSPDREVLSNIAANASSLQAPEKRVVRSVKVIGDTDHTVSLNWRAPTATNTTEFSVLYAVFGERDMRRINVGTGKNRITIDGLVPKTKYIACVCVKGLIPKKEQCVIFSTDEAASASGTQKLINVVVITVACVIAVPLTLIVCCGALKKRCQKLLGREAKDMQDSYVTFETLGPAGKPKTGLETDFLTRLDESNRLLSARSSVDSEATARTEGLPNEYFC
uniref:Uncharacterized protein n=1 Tax=Knipowitschia caucasica TaxID=637954 RepID=A0AAV2LBC7_KNICA